MNVYEARNGASIVRITLEGMTHNIVAALTKHDIEQEQYVREALEKFCSPENLRDVLHKAVERTLKQAIEEEVSNYYRYGDGRKQLADAVAKKLAKGEWCGN